MLLNLDLTGCWWEDCFLCKCEARGGPKGGSNTRVGATYAATCLEYGGKDDKAVYDRETGRSGYYRATKGHKADIERNKVEKSAFAKHTGLYHQDKVGDIYGVVVNNTTKSSLLRQVCEGQSILDNNSEIVLNGKGEWHVGAAKPCKTI